MPYAPDPHRLERIDFSLVVPGVHNDHGSRVMAFGRSSSARAHLWAYDELWVKTDPTRDLSPVDTIHWIALAAWQDRPTSAFQLNRSLRGDPCWDQLAFDL